VKRALVVLALAALAAPADAAAHATLVRTAPANGAVLARAPRTVIVEFDDTVRAGDGNDVVSNTSSASVLDGTAVARGRTLTLPLLDHLPRGGYSVRWSIVSDDGHREQGVLAFAIGGFTGSPRSVLGTTSTVSWSDVLSRTLYFMGLLVAPGA